MRSQTAKHTACLRSFFCFSYGNTRSQLAIQNFVLRRMRRRRLRLRFLQSLQLLYLFYRTRCLQVARRPRRAWVFPRPQNWFQELLNNRALDNWWNKNFRVSRATFEFICRLVGPAIARRNTRMRDAVPVEKRCTTKMCCGFQNYIFLTPDWLNCSCGYGVNVFTQEGNQCGLSLLAFSYLVDKKSYECCPERRRSPDPTPVRSLSIVMLAGVGWVS